MFARWALAEKLLRYTRLSYERSERELQAKDATECVARCRALEGDAEGGQVEGLMVCIHRTHSPMVPSRRIALVSEGTDALARLDELAFSWDESTNKAYAEALDAHFGPCARQEDDTLALSAQQLVVVDGHVDAVVGAWERLRQGVGDEVGPIRL